MLYGFFHPFCNAGGGGERVLWQAVEQTLAQDAQNRVVVYSADADVSEGMILLNVKKRFDIELDRTRLKIAFLGRGRLVLAETWPFLTLLGQAMGSILLVIEALRLPKVRRPDVFIDTMGYPFTYPVVSCWLGIPIVAYVHYPVVSSDMLRKLGRVSQLPKWVYWRLLMGLYTLAGSFVDIVLTNSTWTHNHIARIWWLNSEVDILYPPCSTEHFAVDYSRKENLMVCVAQFRPEKRHELVIREYAAFASQFRGRSSGASSGASSGNSGDPSGNPSGSSSGSSSGASSGNPSGDLPTLVLMGSIRGPDDERFVGRLRDLARDLHVPPGKIQFVLDAQYDTIRDYLARASVGINAMWNEHFGIAVVEYVANGLVPVVHASAGPLLDIVVPWDPATGKQMELGNDQYKTGFFFKSSDDPDFSPDTAYPRLSQVFAQVAQLSPDEKRRITARATACATAKFSDKKFNAVWAENLVKVNSIKAAYDSQLIKKFPLYVWFLIPALALLLVYLKSLVRR